MLQVSRDGTAAASRRKGEVCGESAETLQFPLALRRQEEEKAPRDAD